METTELINLQARATALKRRLEELDAAYQSGDEDIGRITRMKAKLETERVQILLGLQETLGENAPEKFKKAIENAQCPGQDEEVKANLKGVVEEKGLGKQVIDQINKHKGDVIDLIVSIAVKLAAEMMKRTP